MTIYKSKLFIFSAPRRATPIDLGRRGWRRVLALVAMLAMSLGGHPAVAGGWPHLSLLGLTAATTAHANDCNGVSGVNANAVCREQSAFKDTAKACLEGNGEDSLLKLALRDVTAGTGIDDHSATKNNVKTAIHDVNTARTALACQLSKCNAMMKKFDGATCTPPSAAAKKQNLEMLRTKIRELVKSLEELDSARRKLTVLSDRLDSASGAGVAAAPGSAPSGGDQSGKGKEPTKDAEPGINGGLIAAVAGVGATLASKGEKPKPPPQPCGTLATMKEDRCQEHLAEKCKSVKDDFPDSEKAKNETRTICRAWAEDHHCKLGGSAPICNELRLIKICETEPSCPKCKIESMLNECKKSQSSAQGCGGKPLDDAAILNLCSAKKFCLSEDPNCAKLKENIKKGELLPPMTPGGP